MIKFSLYREKALPKDRLICKKINSKGEISILKDVNEFNDILIRFFKEDFRVMINGDTLYVFNQSTVFELLRFPEIINSNLLARMKDAVVKKIPEQDLVPKDNISLATGAVTGPSKSVLSGFFRSNITKTAAAMLVISAVLFTSFFGNYVTFESDMEEDLPTFYNDFMKDDQLKFSPLSYSVILDETYNKIESLEPVTIVSEEKPTIEKESEVSYLEKCIVVKEREFLTTYMLNNLLASMCSGIFPEMTFATSEEALDYLYENPERTYAEKMLVVMARENITYEQFDDICAGCRAEGGEYYDECYRVASVGYNRYHSADFINYFGHGIYTQFLAPSQFSVFYGEKMYLDYKGCIDSIGYQAAIDMFYSRTISTDYLSFRGWWVEVPDDWEDFMYHGNQFGDHQPTHDIVVLDYENEVIEELNQDREELARTNDSGRILRNLNNY